MSSTKGTSKRLKVTMPVVETNPELFEKLMARPGRIMVMPEPLAAGTKITDLGVRYAGDEMAIIAWLPDEIKKLIRTQQGSLEGINVIITIDQPPADNL